MSDTILSKAVPLYFVSIPSGVIAPGAPLRLLSIAKSKSALILSSTNIMEMLLSIQRLFFKWCASITSS
ncbi:hypothetical protein D3C77_747340 [compost metagenome]